MPERVAAFWSQVSDAVLFAVIGLVIGLAQAFKDRERDRAVIVGRAVCVAGFSMSAGTVLIWVPGVPFVALVGVAALLASLGTSGLEKIILRMVGGGSAG